MALSLTSSHSQKLQTRGRRRSIHNIAVHAKAPHVRVKLGIVHTKLRRHSYMCTDERLQEDLSSAATFCLSRAISTKVTRSIGGNRADEREVMKAWQVIAGGTKEATMKTKKTRALTSLFFPLGRESRLKIHDQQIYGSANLGPARIITLLEDGWVQVITFRENSSFSKGD